MTRTPLGRLSIRRKLTFIMAFVAILSVIVAIAGLGVTISRTLKAQVEREVGAVGRLLAANLTAPILFADADAAQSLLSSLERNSDIVAARVRLPGGEVFADYWLDEPPDPAPDPGSRPWTDGGRSVSLAIDLGGERLGDLEIVWDEAVLQRQIDRFLVSSAVVAALAVLIAVALSAFLQRLISRPVEALKDAMTRIAESSDFSVRVPRKSEDELGSLTDRFNQMLEEIEHRDQMLARHRDELEETVVERTAELRRSNEELAATVDDLARARDAAEAASQAKSRFLANMSHEIRTPLHGLLGMSHLLGEGQLTEEQKEITRTIERSGDQLLAIIDDILDLAKIEAGRIVIAQEPFDLWAAIDETVDLFRESASQKGLTLTCRQERNLPRKVVGDSVRFRQVLGNLLSNAIKFTATGRVDVTGEAEQEADGSTRVRCSVRDTGIGLTKEAMVRLFRPFAQADDTTTRRFGGTGLGLAISRHLARSMEGDITVDSRPGEGATFAFVTRLQRVAAADDDGFDRLAQIRALVVTGAAAIDDGPAACLARWAVPYRICPDLETAETEAATGETITVLILNGAALSGPIGTALSRVRESPAFAGACLILYGWPVDAPASDGKAIRVRKPLRGSELFDALIRCLNPDKAQGPDTDGRLARDAQMRPQFDASVLIAEDNIVNQKLICAYLSKLGCQTVLVPDGSQAIEACRKQRFDLVLMDCHMPVLDGFDATLLLRRSPPDQPTPPDVPIIAVTASALAADRVRCLQVGMNEVLTKPFSSGSLARMLQQFIPQCEVKARETAPAQQTAAVATAHGDLHQIMRDAIRSLVDEIGAETAAEICETFVTEIPTSTDQLKAALKGSDAQALRTAAHYLKSSAGQVGLVHVQNACRDLEQLARSGKLNGADELLREIEHLLAAAGAVLQEETSRLRATHPVDSGTAQSR